MSSTIAMFTALSGLTANSRNLDVIGNNIANVNTTAYKSNRMLFSDMFSRTFSIGSPPGDTTGGTNPGQIGLGVGIAGTQRNFGGGTLSPTGDGRDLAIEGDGFFIVDSGGTQAYTRAGAFRKNSKNDVVNVSGDHLMGYGVDQNYNVVEGSLIPINIPVGTMTLAEATKNVRLSGNLNANGLAPTRGSRTALQGTITDGLHTIAGANPAPAAGNLLEDTSRLVDIEDPALPLSGSSLFQSGQFFEVRGVEKGNKTLAPSLLEITDSTTVADFITFMNQVLGLNPAAGANPDGKTPGLSLDPTTGVLNVDGNTGTVNDLRIEPADLRVLSSTGTFVRSPFATSKVQASDGESVRTTMVVYDSLGTPVDVDLTMALESKSNTGTTWRYYVESAEDSDADLVVGTGLIDFDTNGQLATALPVTVNIDRAGTGAGTPLSFELAFSGERDNVTSLTDTSSAIAATYRDGSPIGTLSSFAVGPDGMISGSFTNGLTRPLGRVALATFPNNDGLVDLGSNLFRTGPNSGNPLISAPTTLGAGKVVGGALELSNVDLSAEFIGMILSSTGYSASSRVIQTTNELMQQLLVLGR